MRFGLANASAIATAQLRLNYRGSPRLAAHHAERFRSSILVLSIEDSSQGNPRLFAGQGEHEKDLRQ